MDQAEGMQHQNVVPSGTSEAVQDAPIEKVLKQSEVDELIGRAKHASYEKGKREAQEEMTRMQQTPQGGNGMGGMPSITEDHVRQMIADEAQKQAQFTEVQNTLSSFVNKMESGKKDYSDFNETVANLGDLKHIPHIVKLAADMDNTADIMYELGRNPGKVATLTTLAYTSPHLANVAMKQLSDSIKQNQEAKKAPVAEEPLSRTNPSTVGADNGSRSMRDLRNMSWARG